MEKFFKLKENNTKISTEIIAGFTTFFAMSYIIIVNPDILAQSGMPMGAVFLATIIASAVGTLFMGLFANVPYALAPGMGLNAFFTYVVVLKLGFTWQEALLMVFICGLLNVFITVTKLRKLIVQSIPLSLQNAIGGGIGVFIAYIGLLNVGFINFEAGVPALSSFKSPVVLLTVIGLVITLVLLVLDIKGAILIGIVATTIIGIPMGVTDLSQINEGTSFVDAFAELGTTFGAAFGPKGLGSLFSDASRIPLVLMTIFAFSLADTFDTIGTFIGTGRKSGIFDDDDEKALRESSGFKSKMDKALFADSVGTSVGALVGTSNTTTFVESAAGIGAGGRTGLTSVVVAILFIASAFLSPLVSIVPGAATAPALVAVGIMMLSSFKDINWSDLEDAIPAFFSAIFMGLSYSISDGIATGFIAYCIVKVAKGKAKEVHPIIWGASVLFVINFIITSLL